MDKCVLEDPTVVSPDLQKEKVTVEAAHNIMELKEGSGCNYVALNFVQDAGAVGK